MCGGRLLFSRLPGGSEDSDRVEDDADTVDGEDDELGSTAFCLDTRGDALLLSVGDPAGRATGGMVDNAGTGSSEGAEEMED
jgi:hypothetical protein